MLVEDPLKMLDLLAAPYDVWVDPLEDEFPGHFHILEVGALTLESSLPCVADVASSSLIDAENRLDQVAAEIAAVEAAVAVVGLEGIEVVVALCSCLECDST
jgi:hypothetical protein